MILFSHVASLFLSFWKIQQASKVIRTETFPYYKLEDKEGYEDSETKEFDDIAMNYMSIFNRSLYFSKRPSNSVAFLFNAADRVKLFGK